MKQSRRWQSFAPDTKVDWVGMAQNVPRYNIVIVGKFFNKGNWVSEAWRKAHFEEVLDEPMAFLRECRQPKSEENA